MDDDKKAKLARKGLKAAELLEPGKIGEKVKGSLANAARKAAMHGLAAAGRIPAPESERSPARARAVQAVDLDGAFDAWDADDAARFAQQLEKAAARVDEVPPSMELAALRQSFPAPSRELALLVFNCVDLLEAISSDAEGAPPPPADRARKEVVLQRIAALLAPKAGDALTSFVEHVVALSRRAR